MARDPKVSIDFEGDPDVERILRHYDTSRPNYLVPPPLKPGESCICRFCDKEITPEHFQNIESEIRRKYCFKWQIHEQCADHMEAIADRQTTGLLSERKAAEKRAQSMLQQQGQPEEQEKPQVGKKQIGRPPSKRKRIGGGGR